MGEKQSMDSGELLWTSEPLSGQSARDYYPVVARHEGQTYVILRTNPLLGMDRQIARDRQVLARNAGIDDSDWRNVDAWTTRMGSDAVGAAGPRLKRWVDLPFCRADLTHIEKLAIALEPRPTQPQPINNP